MRAEQRVPATAPLLQGVVALQPVEVANPAPPVSEIEVDLCGLRTPSLGALGFFAPI
jgi:hypothetical protein